MLHETNNMDITPPLYEIRLTDSQFYALTNFLPTGFSLEIGTSTRKSSTKSKGFLSKEVKMLGIDSQFLESVSASKSSPDRRALRDHSKKKVRDHMGRKYTEYDSIAMPTAKPFRPSNEGIRKCYNVLQKLKKNENAEPFLSKADAEEYGLTECFMAVKEPLDLSIIEEKLRDEDYKSVNHFATDVRKIWNNAFRYIPKGTDAYTMAVEISSYFEDLFKEIENVTFTDTVKDLEKRVEQLSQQLVQLHQNQGSQGSVAKSTGSASKSNNGSASKSSGGKGRSMSLEDKKILCQKIKKLPPEHLKGVWDIVAKGMKYSMDNKDKLEFDVHSLPVKVVKELEKYVDAKMNELNKLKSKANSKGGTMQQRQMQMQIPVRNVKPQQQQFMQNSYNMPVKIVKPNLSEYGSVYGGDVPVQQTIEEMDDYFRESVTGDDRRGGDSGDSSFISDSDSESDVGRKHKNRIVDSFIRTSQDVLNYKPGDVTLYPM